MPDMLRRCRILLPSMPIYINAPPGSARYRCRMPPGDMMIFSAHHITGLTAAGSYSVQYFKIIAAALARGRAQRQHASF